MRSAARKVKEEEERPKVTIGILKKWLENERIILADVGTRGGVHERWTRLSPVLRVIGFEPDAEECAVINDRSKSVPYPFYCLPYALGRQDGENRTLQFTRHLGCTSLYIPNAELANEFHFGWAFEVKGNQPVVLTTLDTVCRNGGFVPDCLKIDVQGSALDVLFGGENILPHVLALEMEVEFSPLYIGEPLFSDIDIYLRKHGFMLLGLRRTLWRRKYCRELPLTPWGGQIIHGDVFYINARKVWQENIIDTKGILKFCAILSAYRQEDLLAQILMRPHPALELLTEHERKKIFLALMHQPSTAVKILRKVLRLANRVSSTQLDNTRLRALVDSLKDPATTDWHDPDFY